MDKIKGCKCGHHKKAHVHKHSKAAFFCLACEECSGFEEVDNVLERTTDQGPTEATSY